MDRDRLFEDGLYCTGIFHQALLLRAAQVTLVCKNVKRQTYGLSIMCGNSVNNRITSSASLRFYSWSEYVSVCHFINSAALSDGFAREEKCQKKMDVGERKKSTQYRQLALV